MFAYETAGAVRFLTMFLAAKLWLMKVLPFFGKHLDVVSACCGGCPQCATAAISGLTIEVVSGARAKAEEPECELGCASDACACA